jgi:hypothetical protein
MRERYDIAAITNDIYTKWDAEFLVRSGSLTPDRIAGVETGGCPHLFVANECRPTRSVTQPQRHSYRIRNFLRRSGLKERSRLGTGDVVSRIPNRQWAGLRGHRFDLHG